MKTRLPVLLIGSLVYLRSMWSMRPLKRREKEDYHLSPKIRTKRAVSYFLLVIIAFEKPLSSKHELILHTRMSNYKMLLDFCSLITG